jgi:hypothetical protein
MLFPKLKRIYFYLAYLIFAILYITVSLVAPLGPNRFNLSTSRTHALQLTILLPVVVIWLAAIYGVEKFHSYARLIRKSKDGQALYIMSAGLMILVGSILFNGLIGIVRPWALKDGWLSAYTVFNNYVAVLLPLIAYYVMHTGSRALLKSIKARSSRLSWAGIIILLAVTGAGYIAALMSYDYRTQTPDPSKYNSFYISTPLILATIALPYIIGWALALRAVVNLNQYRKQVKGVIYKRSLFRLEVGIVTVTVFYMFLQLLVAFSTYLAKANLGSILLFLYVLIILYALGFMIIASGTSKLTAIEKIR